MAIRLQLTVLLAYAVLASGSGCGKTEYDRRMMVTINRLNAGVEEPSSNGEGGETGIDPALAAATENWMLSPHPEAQRYMAEQTAALLRGDDDPIDWIPEQELVPGLVFSYVSGLYGTAFAGDADPRAAAPVMIASGTLFTHHREPSLELMSEVLRGSNSLTERSCVASALLLFPANLNNPPQDLIDDALEVQRECLESGNSEELVLGLVMTNILKEKAAPNRGLLEELASSDNPDISEAAEEALTTLSSN